MLAGELLVRLEAVRRCGKGRWSARCPAHEDHHPSLSVREGERVVLVHCFAGCSLQEIVAAVGLTVKELFYDEGVNPQVVREARRRRHAAQMLREARTRAQGLAVDALREADALIHSATNIDISEWSGERLDRELNRLAEAYALLDAEGMTDAA